MLVDFARAPSETLIIRGSEFFNHLMYQLGRRIASYRELRDLTQQELAVKAGLTQTTIARVEKARKPRVMLDTIVSIAEALNVGVDQLLGRDKASLLEEKASELLAAAAQ